jgi:myo-inositol-1(or 4)-monophosphatase
VSSEEELVELAAEAARMAGGLLLARARDGRERGVASKSTPTDLVSEADLASERAIGELLRERRPEDGFVGEEGGDHDPRAEARLEWVVDPLDGTVNFLFGIPQWCVSVAVRDRQGVLAGAVYDPSRRELFTASRSGRPALTGPEGMVQLTGPASRPPAVSSRTPSGPGAPMTVEPAGAARVAISTPAIAADQTGRGDMPNAMVATGLAYDANVREAQARVLARLVGRVRDIRRFGSAALDLSWTAAGRYDAYFERSVKQWDIAAGALICERAGLRVLELPVHEDLPGGILVAPPGLAEPLLELVGGPA